MMKRSLWWVLFGLAVAAGWAEPSRAEQACEAPEPVCAAADGVFIVQAFDPFASAVRISPTRLVTTRHGIADETTVKVMLKDGSVLEGTVIPNAYDGDLILIEVPGLPEGKMLPLAESVEQGAKLYTVAGDDGRRSIRVYPPGRVLLLPSAEAPQGRLHHTAYSQFGNSGGALVDGQGRLVGIIASGGEGRYEAIPVSELARLSSLSGEEFAAQNRTVGEAVRQCTLLLEEHRGRLADEVAAQIAGTCRQTANRQLYDLAASALGRSFKLARAIEISRASVARDPHSLNARLILLTNLHLARMFDEEVPHIRFLLEHLPAEPMVHRFAVQAGKWTGDDDLAQTGLELTRQHNPGQVKAVENFLAADIPRPQPLKLE